MKNHGGPLIMAKRERKPVHHVQMTDFESLLMNTYGFKHQDVLFAE